MSGGENNIQTTNPPSNLEPQRAAITQTSKPNKEAENEPTEKHNKGSLKNYSLRLGKFGDGIKGKYIWQFDGILNIKTRIRPNPIAFFYMEERAASCGGVVQVPRVASAQCGVIREEVAINNGTLWKQGIHHRCH